MTAQTLIDLVLEWSQHRHPEYTREQHLVYTLGWLAAAILEADQRDNIVTIRIRSRLGLD